MIMSKKKTHVKKAEIADFGGEKELKVTGKYDAVNNRWEESSITLPIENYDLENYPVLEYDLYLDPALSVS
jgi:hypothetical protein